MYSYSIKSIRLKKMLYPDIPKPKLSGQWTKKVSHVGFLCFHSLYIFFYITGIIKLKSMKNEVSMLTHKSNTHTFL